MKSSSRKRTAVRREHRSEPALPGSSGKRTRTLISLMVLVAACAEAPPPTDSPDTDGWSLFEDRTDEVGLLYRHVNGADGRLFFNEVVGPGVALFDADLDGDLDVYVTQGHALPTRAPGVAADTADTDRLYRNELSCTGEVCDPTTLRFTDITEEAGLTAEGYGMGVAVGDANADGLPDLYVTNYGPNQLWLNRGDLRFELAWTDTVRNPPRWSTSAVFFDLDLDGDHDLYEVNYVVYDTLDPAQCADQRTGRADYCGPQSFTAEPDRLFVQQAGRLVDESESWDIAAGAGKGLGVVELDADNNGWSDLFVANDLMENYLWIHDGDRFEERAALAGLATNSLGRMEASMGIAVGDVDGDGREDLLSAHLEGETNTLYRNLGNGVFLDVSQASRIGAPSMPYTAFGATFFDADLDGVLDAAIANGAVTIYNDSTRPAEARALEQANQLFLGTGGGRFEQGEPDRVGESFFAIHVSRGLAAGDLDNDGDLDLIYTNNGGPLQVLVNQLQQRAPVKWVGIDVRDANGSAALGATLTRVSDDGSDAAPGQVHRIRRSDSFLSSKDPRVLLPERGDTFEVRWPDGASMIVPALESGRYHRIDRPND